MVAHCLCGALICAHVSLAFPFLVTPALYFARVWTSIWRTGAEVWSRLLCSLLFVTLPLRIPASLPAFPVKRKPCLTLRHLTTFEFEAVATVLMKYSLYKGLDCCLFKKSKDLTLVLELSALWAVAVFSLCFFCFGCLPIKNSHVGSYVYWHMDFKFES